MRNRRRATTVAAGLGLTVAAGLVAAPAASADGHHPGEDSLAALLTADDEGYDWDSRDYDITTAAVLAVLEAKPDSDVGVLTDGSVALTAFVPNDGAFRRLVADLTGEVVWPEEEVFAAVAGLGIDTVETVLLYHVVPGATLDSEAVLDSDGAELTTAQGGAVTVDLRPTEIRLNDLDPDAKDPVVIAADLNEGNRQIAHGLNRVLRPLDL